MKSVEQGIRRQKGYCVAVRACGEQDLLYARACSGTHIVEQ